jgi:nucleotide-binding universal stress UspA family protein
LIVVDPEDLPLILEGVPDPFITLKQEKQLGQRLEEQYEQRVVERLKSEIQFLGKTDAQITPQLRVGTPWQEIVRAADELGASLIVMGSHGKRNLEELLLGSTVERVTRHANCPVLVVR